MPADRLTVRLAYQRGWQVVDGSVVLATFDTKEGAFQHLVEQGARVHLQWGRTVIGGQTAPFDFAAKFQSEYARTDQERDVWALAGPLVLVPGLIDWRCRHQGRGCHCSRARLYQDRGEGGLAEIKGRDTLQFHAPEFDTLRDGPRDTAH
jgi:hypothetical protein